MHSHQYLLRLPTRVIPGSKYEIQGFLFDVMEGTTIVQSAGALEVADIVSHRSNSVLELRISRRPLPSFGHFPR